jgi:hypothetical protein
MILKQKHFMINRNHIVPFILVVLGILDQSTDLFTDLLSQLNAPLYVGTIFKILIIILGAVKIYLIKPVEK